MTGRCFLIPAAYKCNGIAVIAETSPRPGDDRKLELVVNRPISPVFMSDLIADECSRAVEEAAWALVPAPADEDHSGERKREAMPCIMVYRCRLLWFDVPKAFVALADVEEVAVQISKKSDK
eukprot:6614557-Pyramimonas_sp.AAC.1